MKIKKILSVILVVAMILTCATVLSASTVNAAVGQVTTSTVSDDPLLQSLMSQYTSFIVVKHKQMGGSHYAYTEAVSDDRNQPNVPWHSGTETDMWRPGSQMVKLELTKNGSVVERKETVLLESITGTIRDPDVSKDGKFVLFSWKKEATDDYHLYEYNLINGELTQLTFGTGIADTEPKYMPDGRIVFSSTRIIQTVDCWITPVSNLHVCDADGSNIVRLGYDQVHTTYPTLTADGRVLYTRWDYNDRNQMFVQGVFQMFPDGSNQTELFGNGSCVPTTLVHTRDIPGSSNKYVSVATGHHTHQAGKLVILDTAKGRNDADAVEFILSGMTSDKEKEPHVDAFGQSGPLYKYPVALNENEFIVSYNSNGWSNGSDTPFSLMLMNKSGKRIELSKGTTQYPASQIAPIAERTMFERPSMVNYAKDTGTYYIGDIYEGEGLKGVARGVAKTLRVVALDYRSYAIGATIGRGTGSSDPFSTISTGNGAWDVKRVLGVVPIEEDGSALFEVPSETPIYFQVLDEKGEVIQSMRSWSTLMPGEVFSCVGCHEDKNTVPPAIATTTMAMAKGVQKLQPDVWQQGEGYEEFDPYTTKKGFSFVEEIQPILDESCVTCHNNTETAYDAISLSSMGGADATIKDQLMERTSAWKYTTTSPGPRYVREDFDDSAWATGTAPFGKNGTAPGGINTTWDTDNIWLRSEFELNSYQLNDLNLIFDISCVMLPEIFINGKLVYSGNLATNDYTQIAFTDTMKEALKVGKNVIAVTAQKGAAPYAGNFFGLGIIAQRAAVEDTVEVVSLKSEWKYRKSSSNSVAAGWNDTGFNDATWSTGRAPFGDREAGSTDWSGGDNYIWVRKTFNIENVEEYLTADIVLNTWYDDNPKFYLNGQQIFADSGWVDAYKSVNLGASFSKYLKEGENVFAIAVMNTTGGRTIDSSMTLKKNAKAREELFKTKSDWKVLMNNDAAVAENWTQTDFNDSSWQTRTAPLTGDNNSWTTDYIFMRKELNIPDISVLDNMKLYLEIRYDENPVVYINGNQVYSATGHTGNFKNVALPANYIDYLVEGKNVIAVSALNTGGGQYIDCGMSAMELSSSPISLVGTNMYGSRLRKNMPLSYLVLTNSTPDGPNWLGNSTNTITNWISSMSQCEILEPYQFGANKSNIMSMLRSGHGGLTEEQISKFAAWIDLGVPAFGSYLENNDWAGDNAIAWAEKYQSKRDFFTLMNEHARKARAAGGTVGGDKLKVAFKGGLVNISKETAGLATLNVPKKYAENDIVTIDLPEGETYLMVSLHPMLGEELVYCPDGVFTYKFTNGFNAYVNNFGEYMTNTVTARLATSADLTKRRNLAENVYDLAGATNVYPHATTDSVYYDDNDAAKIPKPQYMARNAIDGFTANKGHEHYPFQSWGPKTADAHYVNIDLGREVYLDELEVFIRADFPHDTYYRDATLTFSDGTTKDVQFIKTEKGQSFKFDEILTSSVKIDFKNAEDPGGWAAISEIKFYGVDSKEEPAPTTIWTIIEEKGIVVGMPLGTGMQAFKDGFSTPVTVKKNGTEVTSGLTATNLTVDFNNTTYTAAVIGDVDGNGTANLADIVALRNFIMGINTPNNAEFYASDCDDNNTLNLADIVALRNIIMGVV